jgi:predicted HTH domain antitoxin
MDTVDISVTLPRSVLAAAKVRDKELSDLMRESLALQLYRSGRISIGKAAEVAGLSTKSEMMQLLAKYDVPIDYSVEDARRDLEIVTATLDE